MRLIRWIFHWNVMQALVVDCKPNTKVMKQAAEAGFATATDLADWLVRILRLPFRQAHHITGQLVKLAETRA